MCAAAAVKPCVTYRHVVPAACFPGLALASIVAVAILPALVVALQIGRSWGAAVLLTCSTVSGLSFAAGRYQDSSFFISSAFARPMRSPELPVVTKVRYHLSCSNRVSSLAGRIRSRAAATPCSTEHHHVPSSAHMHHLRPQNILYAQCDVCGCKGTYLSLNSPCLRTKIAVSQSRITGFGND